MEKHEWWVSWGGLVPLQHQQFCPVSSTSQPESDIWGITRRKGLKKFTISDYDNSDNDYDNVDKDGQQQ